MEYLIGLGIALGVIAYGASLRFDRDRSFAPTLLIVVAHYYVLFALMGGTSSTLVTEGLVAGGFVLIGVLGVKTTPWLVAGAMVGHGVFDLVHGSLIHNAGLPVWWPGFCMTFDVVFGGWLVALLVRRAPSAV